MSGYKSIDRIRTVTAGTFDRLVLKGEGPIVVEFMSYGCAHCGVIEPDLQQVAEMVESTETNACYVSQRSGRRARRGSKSRRFESTGCGEPAIRVMKGVWTMQSRNQTAPVLLFNDECGVCRSIAGWVKKQVQAGSGTTSIMVRPIGQDPEELRALNQDLNI